MTAEVIERTGQIRDMKVRWVNVIVAGHTVEQALSFDVADAKRQYMSGRLMTSWTNTSRLACSPWIAYRPMELCTRSRLPPAMSSTANVSGLQRLSIAKTLNR